MNKVLLVSLALWVTAGKAAELRLTVSVNNLAGIEHRTLAGAEGIASVLFQRVGVELTWEAYPKSRAAAADFRLNLAAAIPEEWPKGCLGYAAISKDGKGQLIYAFRSELDKHPVGLRAILLGHVIAHEIGHLLLGPDHTRSGIMCTGWHASEIRLASTGLLEFSREQGKRIRATIEAKR